MLDIPFTDGIMHHPHAIGIGDADGAIVKSIVFDEAQAVISPSPFKLNQAAGTGSFVFSFGKITVTPVRTGPFPVAVIDCSLMIVLYPIKTPGTSVMALKLPGLPSNGIARSLALGFLRDYSANTIDRKKDHTNEGN